MSYRTVEISDEFWRIEENEIVHVYVMKTSGCALLIDTGFGSGELNKLVEELTGFSRDETIVLHTHCHGDHTSGDKMFKNFVVSEAEAEAYRNNFPEDAVVQVVHGGDVLFFGEVMLEVLDTPGHTPGAISYLDENNKRLFSGDNFGIGWPIYMQFPDQNLEKYIESIKYLQSIRRRYRTIYPCHGQVPFSKGLMEYVIRCAEGILDGTLPDIEVEMHDGTKQKASEYEGIVILHS